MENNCIFRCPFSMGIKPVFDSNSKILMVGSLTTRAGMERGFYYASGQNFLWEWIDNCFDKKVYQSLKEELKDNYHTYKLSQKLKNIEKKQVRQNTYYENIKTIQNKFNIELNNDHIAMCDIFKFCYAVDDSSEDSKIAKKNGIDHQDGTMKDEIKSILESTKISTIFVNSKNVKNWFEQFGFDLEKQFGRHIDLVQLTTPSGILRRTKGGNQNVVNAKEEWKTKIRNALDLYS